MFLKRSFKKEIMDDLSIQDSRIDKALNELKIINKYLGGISATKYGIKKIIYNKKDNFKILDLGGGGSDNFFFLRDTESTIFSIDLNLQACKFTSSNKNKIKSICANAKQIPFKNKTITISNASLFFHHFSDDVIINMLKSLKQISTDGIIINDLRRNIVAFLSIKLLTRFFSKSKMVKNDAPLSVKRAFVKSEIKNILLKSGISNFEIHRRWAFRWLVIIYL